MLISREINCLRVRVCAAAGHQVHRQEADSAPLPGRVGEGQVPWSGPVLQRAALHRQGC